MQINLPKTALKGPVELEWKIPHWSNTLERNRARTYFQAYAAACALHFVEQALVEMRAGRTKTCENSRSPTRPSAAASPRPCAACSRTTW